MPDYLVGLIEDKPTFFIIVGMVLLALAIGVKFIGKLEIDPKGQKLAGVVGAIFLIVGLAATYYPSDIAIHGYVKNWNGEPLTNAYLQIGSLADFTDEIGGEYSLHGVSRESTNLMLEWHGKKFNKTLNLPEERKIKEVERPINLTRKSVEISGIVYNESDNPVGNAKVAIAGADIVTTESDGYYAINDVKCHVLCPIDLNVSVGGKLRYRMQNLYLTQDEIESGQKSIDIHLPNESTILVYGTVSYYNKSHKVPISGAIVDIDGATGTSDSKGNYKIPYVSREATSYNTSFGGNTIKVGKLDANLNQAEYRYSREYKQMINVPNNSPG